MDKIYTTKDYSLRLIVSVSLILVAIYSISARFYVESKSENLAENSAEIVAQR